MNDKQIDLIMQIVQEQLEDYLDDELAAVILAGIAEGSMTTCRSLTVWG